MLSFNLGSPRWRVTSEAGRLVILDHGGLKPLELPDETARIQNLFLAAAAPGLLEALKAMTARLEYLAGESGDCTGYTRKLDSGLLQQAHAAMIDSRPREEELEGLLHRNLQLDLFAEVA